VVGAGPTFASIATTSLTVSWTAASDAATVAADLEYQLVRGASISDLGTLAEVEAVTGAGVVLSWSAGTLTADVSGLSPQQTLAFAVLVRDAAGLVSLYPAQAVTTPAIGAPTSGTGITFSNVTDGGFTATWGAATSEETAGADLEYMGVVGSTQDAVDTVAGAEALTGANVLFPWTKNLLTTTASGVAGNTTSWVAILVRDDKGLTSLYSPTSVTTKHHRLIFMTSGSYTPLQLSTPAAADGFCNDAKPAGRGTFKAMLVGPDRIACQSTDCQANGASEHTDWVMGPNTTYENTAGDVLWTTGTAGIVPGNPTHPDIYAATGNGILVWTGIDAGWINGASCQNWTSGAPGDNGFCGVANYGDSTAWTMIAIPCDQAKPIYCVEQ
jgi:hypothetical protein